MDNLGVVRISNSPKLANIHKSEKRISFIIVFQISMLLIKNMFVSTLQFAFIYNSYLNTIIYMTMGFIYLDYVLKHHFKIKFLSIIILLSCLIFWLLTYMLNPKLFQYSYLTDAIRIFIVYCIPLVVFVPLLNNADSLLDSLYVFSRFTALMAIVCWILVIVGLPTVGDYSMSYGKAAVVPCVVLIIYFLEFNRVSDLFLFLGSLLGIILLGSRWPLLSIAAAFIYGSLRYLSIKSNWKIILVILFVIILLLFYSFSGKIFVSLNQLLANLGINSRTLNLLVSGNIAYTSGRTTIHEELILKLFDSPLLGYGAGGGYVVLDNGLPHHFILDCFANFGFPLGTFLLGSSIGLSIYRYWKNRFNSYGKILLIYSILLWPKVSVGESFWGSDKYWMIISLLVLGHYMEKSRKKVIG